MAASKRQKVTEKHTSSDEKIKGLSLYFLQGKKLIFEGLEWLDFVRRLDGLTDEKKLEQLAELGRKYKAPRVSIRTLKVSDEGETFAQHSSVPIQGEGDGRYALTVPELYPDDGPDEYEVCGAVMSARSWTTALHNEWDAYMDERGLTKLEADINELSTKIREEMPTSEDISTMWLQLPGLEKSRAELVLKEAQAYTNLEMEDTEVEKISARLKLITQKIEGIKSAQREWSKSNDPFQQAINMHPEGKDLKEKNQKYEDAFLAFVHRLAERYGLTSQTFDEWREDATKLDRANAMELVAKGNEPWTSGQASQALSKEDKEKRAYAALSN